MKTRRLKMPVDGRLFVGTPKEILTQMHSLAFGWDGRTLAEYLDWLKQQMEQQTGAEIEMPEGDVATACEALVNAMVAHGLALEIVSGGE
jgi:hypothetical protein